MRTESSSGMAQQENPFTTRKDLGYRVVNIELPKLPGKRIEIKFDAPAPSVRVPVRMYFDKYLCELDFSE